MVQEILEQTKISMTVKVVGLMLIAVLGFYYSISFYIIANTENIATNTANINALAKKTRDQSIAIAKLTEQSRAIKENTDELKADIKYLIRKADISNALKH